MNRAVGHDRKIEQARRLAADRGVTRIQQLRHGFRLVVFGRMIKPIGADRSVHLSRYPRVPAFQSEVQHVPRHVARRVQRAPVHFADVAGFHADPAQVPAVAPVVPNDDLGLKLPNQRVSVRPVVIGLRINPRFSFAPPQYPVPPFASSNHTSKTGPYPVSSSVN